MIERVGMHFPVVVNASRFYDGVDTLHICTAFLYIMENELRPNIDELEPFLLFQNPIPSWALPRPSQVRESSETHALN